MSAYEHIKVEKQDGVAILTLNRPEVLNAMNNRLSTELHDAVNRMVQDDDVGCIAGAYQQRIGVGTHRIETPVGVISVQLKGLNEVTIENVPSYRYREGVQIEFVP